MYSDFFVVHSTVCKSHDIVRFPRRHFDKLSKNCETLFTRDESSYQWEKEIDGLEISSYRENRGPLKFVSLATSPRLVRFFPLQFFFFFFFFLARFTKVSYGRRAKNEACSWCKTTSLSTIGSFRFARSACLSGMYSQSKDAKRILATTTWCVVEVSTLSRFGD